MKVYRKGFMSIAEQIVNATTPGLKAAVTKKINAIVAQAATEGKNTTQVRAGFKAAATRLRAKQERHATMVQAGQKAAATRRQNAAVV